MKLPMVTAFVLVLYGCAASTPQPAPSAGNGEVGADLISAVMKKRFEDKGENILCDQPAYLQCFGISNAQCVSDQSAFKPQCIDYSAQKAGELQYGKNGKEYAGAFSSCMVMHHLVLYKGDLNELGNCLKTAKYDKEIAANSLSR